jgi:hypothetical protein
MWSVNLYWLQADKHLILFDEAHHIQRSVAFHDALFPTEPERMFARVLAALSLESPYPPLSHLAGAAVIRRFGGAPPMRWPLPAPSAWSCCYWVCTPSPDRA